MYVYFYNMYTGLWAAVRKGEEVEYHQGEYPHKDSKAIFNKDITELIKYVQSLPVKEEEPVFKLK